MNGDATFGIWYAEDGVTFRFQRWLKASEADARLPLIVAAQAFLDKGGPRGSELRPGRYLIQCLNRGTSGADIQCLLFDAVQAPAPLRVSVPHEK